MSGISSPRSHLVVGRVADWARGRERPNDATPLVSAGTSPIAAAWATLKLGIVGLLSPFWAPALMARAAVNNRRAQRLTAAFPTQVRSIAAGRNPAAPSNRVTDIPAAIRLVTTSDLHRCVGGRLDWPARQRTKALYEQMLDLYAADDWSLCENGDIEDYWIVGGTTYGAVYDAMRIVGGAMARYGRVGLLTETYRRHLDEIIENNAGIYRRIRDDFVRRGRYYRTVGNHDNANSRTAVAERLRHHLGEFAIGDYVALRDDEGDLVGLICHGHHTDGWNAPERDNLGKLSAWIANTLIDVPRLQTPEGLPAPDAQEQMRAGRTPDRLITVNPTFGANTQYDSLDEELLCEAVHGANLADIWLVLGHTHFPLSSPVSRTGRRWERYLNSGCGVTDGMVTAVEWDGTGDEPVARLVAWTWADRDTPADAIRVTSDGHRVARYVLEPDGDRLVPFADTDEAAAEPVS